MFKKKSLFITFEGIEGSGKSYQAKKLYNKILKIGLKPILTREPGGTKSAERIRKIILDDYFHDQRKEKFGKYTDTLLYLAARNEHIHDKIKPAILRKKIVICDRFVDSTMAYQVYGKGVNKKFITLIHKKILGNIKPDITFIFKLNINKAMKRINQRKSRNRYDNFTKKFYLNVQRAFLKIARTNKKRYIVLDTSKDTKETENVIFEKIKKVLKK